MTGLAIELPRGIPRGIRIVGRAIAVHVAIPVLTPDTTVRRWRASSLSRRFQVLAHLLDLGLEFGPDLGEFSFSVVRLLGLEVFADDSPSVDDEEEPTNEHQDECDHEGQYVFDHVLGTQSL